MNILKTYEYFEIPKEFEGISNILFKELSNFGQEELSCCGDTEKSFTNIYMCYFYLMLSAKYARELKLKDHEYKIVNLLRDATCVNSDRAKIYAIVINNIRRRISEVFNTEDVPYFYYEPSNGHLILQGGENLKRFKLTEDMHLLMDVRKHNTDYFEDQNNPELIRDLGKIGITFDSDVWTNTKIYENNTFVTTGSAIYFSLYDVPENVDISDDVYWLKVVDFAELVK